MRLRPNDSMAPLRSMTITGASSAQIVIRKSPGTMRSTKPMPIASPPRNPATSSEPITGATEESSEPTVWSRRPSRMSCAASTTMPWNQ